MLGQPLAAIVLGPRSLAHLGQRLHQVVAGDLVCVLFLGIKQQQQAMEQSLNQIQVGLAPHPAPVTRPALHPTKLPRRR
jgi:hypothetical protein